MGIGYRRTAGGMAIGMAVAWLSCACAAAVDLRETATAFINDKDALEAILDEVGDDRSAMESHLADENLLQGDVEEFFKDRLTANLLRLKLKVDRKLMKKACRELGYEPWKLRKPSRPSWNLGQDASEYIDAWKAWKQYLKDVRDRIQDIEDALAGGDSQQLYDAVTAYFNTRRLRHEARLMWQSRLKAIKKQVGFKGTGSPEEPAGDTLAAVVTEYLADRDQWKNLSDTVDDDRGEIEANLGDDTALWNAVSQFFADRRLLQLKSRELAMDRKAMRKEFKERAGLSLKEKLMLKVGAALSAGSEDAEDEEGDLDEDANAGGGE